MASAGTHRWSGRVTRESHALVLDRRVFAKDDPRAIARSLKRSADRSNAQGDAVSFGNVDADVLRESRRKEALGLAQEGAGPRQG
jgi:hypothetical protein